VSYQVIARKWRPQAFDEVTGQGHVTTPLRNAIRSGRIPHALLLTGPRGTGKTTLARLIARCLNCEKGPTDEPCGSCVPCEEINAGRSTDVQEIDAASRTSVDDMREVIESIRYAPSPGKHKIFVVDEVHMLSTAAFNALLKTLEEPPPRSLFVFATTNPEKIPFTVLSRCQRYDLRRIPTAEVTANLARIAEAEGVSISQESLRAIAREGDGSLRDAQTLLDQVIAYAPVAGDAVEVSDDVVVDVLDLIDRRILMDIVRACIEGEPSVALQATARATASGAEASRLATDLVELLRDLVVTALGPENDELVEANDADREELRELAGQCGEARLRRMFRALVKEMEDLAWAPQPSAVLEMAIVRLATMPDSDDVSRLLGRLERLEKRLASGAGSGEGGEASGGGGGSRARPTRAAREPAEARGRPSGGAARAMGDSPETGAAVERDAAERPAPAPEPAPPARRGAPPDEPTADPAAPPARVAGAERQRPAAEPRGDAPARGHGERPAAERGQAAVATGDAAASTAPSAGPAARSERASTGPAGTPDDPLFDRIYDLATERNRGLFASLRGGRLLRLGSGALRIELSNGFHVKRLQDKALPELEQLCSDVLGEPTRVELTVPSTGAEAAESGPAARERERARRQQALRHPAINVALEELKGEIVEIKPL